MFYKMILFAVCFTMLFCCGVVRAQHERVDSLNVQKEYSLWFVPKGEKLEFLQQRIGDLSRKHKGPIFIPHITLIGNIRMTEEAVLAKSKQLANLLRPFPVVLNGVSYGDEYYRCIFASVEKSDPLTKAHEQALEIFETTPGEFMPHLSLLYGNHEITQKEKIAAELQIKESLSFTNLHVFETSKHLEPGNWRLIGTIPFGNR